MRPRGSEKANDNNTSFTYTNSRHQKRGSFCEFFPANAKAKVTYIKDRQLGTGSFGKVSLMVPKNNKKNTPIAVKEYCPSLRYIAGSTLDQITAHVTSQYELFALEAEFNRLYHGVGAYFCDNEQFKTGRNNNNEITLTSYPHSYVVMTYVAGTVLRHVHIDSAEKLFAIITEALKALQHLHTLFVHGDLHLDNIILTDNGQIRFIDFTLSRFAGELLPIKELNPRLEIKPPEFQGKNSIAAHPNQDIHSLGRIFEYLHDTFTQLLVNAEIKDMLRAIITRMMANEPADRPTTKQLIEDMENLLLVHKYRTDSKQLNEREILLARYLSRRAQYISLMPSTDSIEKWCLCEKYIKLLKSDDPTPEVIRLASHGITQLDTVTFNKYEGASQLLNYTDDASLIESSSRIKDLLSRVAPIHRRKTLELLFTLFADYYEAVLNQNFSQEIMDKWCYCSRFIMELKQNVASIDNATFGYDKLQAKTWEAGLGVKRLIHAMNEDISLLCAKLRSTSANMQVHLLTSFNTHNVQKFVKYADDLIALLRTYKGRKQEIMTFLGNKFTSQLREFTLAKLHDLRVLTGQRLDKALLINVTASLTAREPKMEPFLIQLDNFNSDNQTPAKRELYRDMLYACNNVYRQRRDDDDRDYYVTFFGRLFGYSRERKIARSFELENDVIIEGPSAQGDLGAIAKRMQKA